MRKLFIGILSVLLMYNFSVMGRENNRNITGIWGDGDITVTFTKDSLFIEDNIEGDAYAYLINGDTVYYQSDIDRYDGIVNKILIISQDTNTLIYKYCEALENDNLIITLNRK